MSVREGCYYGRDGNYDFISRFIRVVVVSLFLNCYGRTAVRTVMKLTHQALYVLSMSGRIHYVYDATVIELAPLSAGADAVRCDERHLQ